VIATLVIPAIPVSIYHLDDDARLSGDLVGGERNDAPSARSSSRPQGW
jgi:hypothetical protein